MRVCVLQPSYRGSTSPIAALDPPRDLSPWLAGHDVEHVFLEKATLSRRLRGLRADVFINLCDGAWNEDTPGIDVVQALERARRAFTGAGATFYDPTRVAMKEACVALGVDTPAGVFAYDERGIADAVARLRLPCFVKPHHGYNSVGITERSRVLSADALRREARRVIAEFGGALVEEFIDGREFCVLAVSDASQAEPVTHAPVECAFEPGVPFKTFDYKWRTSGNHWTPCTDLLLARRLRDATARVYRALGGTGYARSDIRVSPDGRLFFLELNPNCSVFYPPEAGGTADVILDLEGPGGAGRRAFVERIIAFALDRQARSRRTVTARAAP